jgi:uncharacterized membrane protein YcaP (DUF421 family)
MWDDLTTIGVPLADKIVRTIVVYLALLVLLRLVGKRDLAQLNSFDLVVMLLLSNVVQNAIIGDDNSLLGGLVGAVTLLAVNWLVAWLAAGPARVGRLLEGTATVLAEDGRYRWTTLRRLGLRRADVDVAIRRQGGRPDPAGVARARRHRAGRAAPGRPERHPRGPRHDPAPARVTRTAGGGAGRTTPAPPLS